MDWAEADRNDLILLLILSGGFRLERNFKVIFVFFNLALYFLAFFFTFFTSSSLIISIFFHIFSDSPRRRDLSAEEAENMGCDGTCYILLMFVFFLTYSDARLSSKVGINYGKLGENLPSPLISRSLIDSINSGGVKIYDADPSILKVLSNTNIPISIMVPNQLIPAIGTNLSAADQWVKTNLLPFIPDARVRYLLVGNEILSDYSIRNSTWGLLVPAIVNIKRALTSLSVKDVKVGTTMAMDVLSASFPPSAGEFRKDIAKDVVAPMLEFLRKTRSFFFIDAYPYFVWSENWKSVSLEYALLDPKATTSYVDAGTKLVYKNILEQMLDAVAFAMDKLGYSDVPIAIAETGWPNAGDYDQIGANPRNAATYNRNLARWVEAGKHTPARPKKNKSPSFVFSLFNENQKPGRGTERHWGVFYPNGSHVYGLDLSGRTADAEYPNLPPGKNNEPYKGKIWCVVAPEIRKPSVNVTADLNGALAYACGQGNNTCDAILEDGKCREPNTVVAHASYAFNSYWQQFRWSGGTCFFNGLAEQTVVDPSKCLPRWILTNFIFLIGQPLFFRCLAVQVSDLASTRLSLKSGIWIFDYFPV